jgi:hypothetical protein
LMRGYPIGSILFWKVDRQHCHDAILRIPLRLPRA